MDSTPHYANKEKYRMLEGIKATNYFTAILVKEHNKYNCNVN
jgi:hypothetical protein